jgi:hypothetical protein
MGGDAEGDTFILSGGLFFEDDTGEGAGLDEFCAEICGGLLALEHAAEEEVTAAVEGEGFDLESGGGGLGDRGEDTEVGLAVCLEVGQEAELLVDEGEGLADLADLVHGLGEARLLSGGVEQVEEDEANQKDGGGDGPFIVVWGGGEGAWGGGLVLERESWGGVGMELGLEGLESGWVGVGGGEWDVGDLSMGAEVGLQSLEDGFGVVDIPWVAGEDESGADGGEIG